MGQLLKNKVTYGLNDDIADFFSLPTLEEENKINYDELKEKIYASNKLDKEEKANIINKINSISFNTSTAQKEKIIKEIEEFKRQYNL